VPARPSWRWPPSWPAFDLRFRIVDRHPDWVHESRALAIQPRTLEVLARHGLATQLVEAGNPAVQLRLHTSGRIVAVPLFDIGIADTTHPFLLFLSQAEIERILSEHPAKRRGGGAGSSWSTSTQSTRR
jgi:2-polyprenyl-6-methoxyphenol hydroxylase-like FAD-dependent oxidoreductase